MRTVALADTGQIGTAPNGFFAATDIAADAEQKKVRVGFTGTDFLELSLFLKGVKEKPPTPIDIYDSATMSSIVGLSEQSIAQGGKPVECPDFTRGAWKTRKPAFGVIG